MVLCCSHNVPRAGHGLSAAIRHIDWAQIYLPPSQRCTQPHTPLKHIQTGEQNQNQIMFLVITSSVCFKALSKGPQNFIPYLMSPHLYLHELQHLHHGKNISIAITIVIIIKNTTNICQTREAKKEQWPFFRREKFNRIFKYMTRFNGRIALKTHL